MDDEAEGGRGGPGPGVRVRRRHRRQMDLPIRGRGHGYEAHRVVRDAARPALVLRVLRAAPDAGQGSPSRSRARHERDARTHQASRGVRGVDPELTRVPAQIMTSWVVRDLPQFEAIWHMT